MDYLPTPSPSPELRRRKDVSGEENAHRERHTLSWLSIEDDDDDAPLEDGVVWVC
jgi:hypothetical protein